MQNAHADWEETKCVTPQNQHDGWKE